MDGKQMLYCLEEQRMMQELLGNVKDLIKDSDAAAEKEMIKGFLQEVSEAVTFVAAGDSASGKTGLLNAVLPVGLPHAGRPTQGIVETRYGAQDMLLQVENNYIRQFVSNSKFEGIAAYDMQGLDTMQDASLKEKVKSLIHKSDVLLILFDADKIRSFSVWEFLEGVDRRKMVFVMTGCDRLPEEKVKENELKLRSYMQEEGIDAPLYCVCLGTEQEEQTTAPLREYIRKEILGDNPILTNQCNNIENLDRMLSSLRHSFLLRKKQFEKDSLILQDIDRKINTFMERNESKVEGLKKLLRQVISQEIDNYQNNVIKRLDPYTIKERFQGGEAAFQEFLDNINETCKDVMNQRVSNETQKAVRAYLADLEIVFEEATGFFRKRENLIALEDRFYGSLAESKRSMIGKTETTLQTTTEFYGTLSQASEELFHKIWAAREKYDKQVAVSTAVGTAVGAGAGIGIGLLGAHLAAAAATTAATAATTAAAATTATAAAASATTVAAASAFWPVIGCIIGAVAIALIARKLAKACSGAHMMRAVEECIRDFKKEVAQIKETMITEVMEVVGNIFARELDTVDKSFLEFRMSVNIDSRNIPVLEQKMETVEMLMDQVRQMKEAIITRKEDYRCLRQNDRHMELNF